MAASSRIVVRKAREEDYQAVLDITAEFNNGADYLNVQYSELINDPDSSYYVCEVDGEVAAFEGVSLVDDNKTLMTRSARVKEKFRGQGLLTAIRKKIYDDYKDVPGEKRVRTCCTNLVRLVDSPTFRSQNRTLAIRPLVVFQPLETIQLPEAYNNHVPDARETDLDCLSAIFQIPQLVSYLFPAGFLIVISWFFEPLISNMKHIKKQQPHVVISAALENSVKKFSSQSDLQKPQPGMSSGCDKETKGSPLGLLAVIAYYTSPNMILIAVDLYGEPRQGYEDCDVQHVLFHCLKIAIAAMEKDESHVPLCLGIGTRNTAITDICTRVLKPLGFHHVENYKCHYFFEQDFEKLLK
ncbi:hypothetical protein BsWGS_12819 [Bradybaena similaris]